MVNFLNLGGFDPTSRYYDSISLENLDCIYILENVPRWFWQNETTVETIAIAINNFQPFY